VDPMVVVAGDLSVAALTAQKRQRQEYSPVKVVLLRVRQSGEALGVLRCCCCCCCRVGHVDDSAGIGNERVLSKEECPRKELQLGQVKVCGYGSQRMGRSERASEQDRVIMNKL
jgi:hypothetical protein